MTTYQDFSDICTRFYDLVIDPDQVADFVAKKISAFQIKEILFVGGFFLVAKEIAKRGYSLTIVDYTDQMVAEGKKRLPDFVVNKADLRSLPFTQQFDCVLVIGRVFTHMLTEEDAVRALRSVLRSLRPGGLLFFDNYEASKIQRTDYFNGEVIVQDSVQRIVRSSTTSLISTEPFVVNWSARYEIASGTRSGYVEDEMLHRAFSREEIEQLLNRNHFAVIASGDNFDETSFYTLAKKL